MYVWSGLIHEFLNDLSWTLSLFFCLRKPFNNAHGPLFGNTQGADSDSGNAPVAEAVFR